MLFALFWCVNILIISAKAAEGKTAGAFAQI